MSYTLRIDDIETSSNPIFSAYEFLLSIKKDVDQIIFSSSSMQEKFNKIFVERQEIIEAIILISKKYFDEFTYLDPDASYSEDVNAFYSAFSCYIESLSKKLTNEASNV
jgi:hypothetical protein